MGMLAFRNALMKRCRHKSGEGRDHMAENGFDRRNFLKGAVVGGAAAATAAPTILPQSAAAQQGNAPASPAYEFFNLEEAAFVEVLVDHMLPADDITPKGTDVGLN